MKMIKPPHGADLTGMLKCLNGDMNTFRVVCCDGNYYVKESSIENFAIKNEIKSTDIAISNICKLHGLKNLTVIPEATQDEYLQNIDACISLLEINAVEVVSATDQANKFKTYISQATAFILGREYDNIADLDKNINKCNELLDDIEEEKQKIRDGQSNSSMEFTFVFFGKCATKVFTTFILPVITSGASKIPAFIMTTFNPSTVNKVVKVIQTGEIVSGTADLLSDLRGLYLSMADYDKLLDEYYKKIAIMKAHYQKQKTKSLRAKARMEK